MGIEKPGQDTSISLAAHQSIDNLDPTQYNILVPSLSMGHNLPPGVTLRLAMVKLNPDPEMRDVWKLPTKEKRIMLNNNGTSYEGWAEVYEPTSKALDRLRWAIGADVDCVRNDDQSNPLIKSFKARISLRRADGTLQTATGEYELEIGARVEEFRAKLSDQLEDRGYIEKDVWEEEKGRQVKRKKQLTGEAGSRHIDRMTRDYRIHLQKHGARLADTRARAAAMRAFVALKGSYTAEELKRPFVLAYYEFAPEFSPSALLQMYGINQSVQPKMAEVVSPAPEATSQPPEAPSGTVQGPSGATQGQSEAILWHTDPVLNTQSLPTEQQFADAQALLGSAVPPPTITTDKPSIKYRLGMIEELSTGELRELIDDIAVAKKWSPLDTSVLTRDDMLGYVRSLPKKAGAQ